jgi:restriction system protein
MPRKRKYHPLTESILTIGFVIVGGTICIIISWFNNSNVISCNVAVFLILALIIGTPIAFIVSTQYKIAQERKLDEYLENEREKKFKGIQIANIDSMTGIEFEQYLQKLLTNQGYSVNVTQASGDLGVDLIASRDGDKIAIQAKRYSTNVSRRAISDAVAGMYHYGCNKAMVITNSYFSPGAVTLAESTDCILINRDTLAEWVIEFQSIDSVKQNRA